MSVRLTVGDLYFTQAGSGPPVVLLHPVGLDHTFWGGLADRIATTNMVIGVDLRGHGRSPPADRPGRIDAFAADVVALLEGLGSGPAILLGLSFGGMIAQTVAVTRPDLVAGLILCGCPGQIPSSLRNSILARAVGAETGGMPSVVASTLDRWFTADFLGDPAVERVRQHLLINDASNWAAAWEAISGHDALDRLTRFEKPALVIAGEKDAATSIDASKALAAAMPASELVILPGAPHMMQIESADLFTEAVIDFLACRRTEG